MMQLDFFKYDGAGNDFVVLDIRHHDPQLSTEAIAHICHRRFGVGADGLMTLAQAPAPYDFEMKYYNSDGRLGSMCGNGGRCITAFAYRLGLGHLDSQSGRHVFDFLGFDGPHHAEIISVDDHSGKLVVQLGMRDVEKASVRQCLDGWFLDTGSPHYVQRVHDLDRFDVVGEGRRLRNNTEQFPQGTNVDFVEELPDGRLSIRTFERGVEDETWACGTGVTACALVMGIGNIQTRGGDFKVSYNDDGTNFCNVMLTGPVSFNFAGTLNIM